MVLLYFGLINDQSADTKLAQLFHLPTWTKQRDDVFKVGLIYYNEKHYMSFVMKPIS